MASSISTRNLDGDYNRIGVGDGPVTLDWGGNAQIVSEFGIMHVGIGVWLADPLHDRLGLIQ